jgi:hypothetical protein
VALAAGAASLFAALLNFLSARETRKRDDSLRFQLMTAELRARLAEARIEILQRRPASKDLQVDAPRRRRVRLLRPQRTKEDAVARKTVLVSDFSAKEIPDAKQSVEVVLRYADGRRGQIVADAHVDDDLVKQIASAGRQQARRGRKPKAESS